MCRRIVVIIGFVIFSTVISIDILAQRLFLRLFHRFTMTQENDASHLTAESAPASEDDTASPDGNPASQPPPPSDIEAAASAPNHLDPDRCDLCGEPFWDDFWLPCHECARKLCGNCATVCRYTPQCEWEYCLEHTNNHVCPAATEASHSGMRLPTLYNRGVGPMQQADELWARIAREGWSYRTPLRLIGVHRMNRAGTGVDPHRAQELAARIARDGWSAESPRDWFPAVVSSWEPSAVSACTHNGAAAYNVQPPEVPPPPITVPPPRMCTPKAHWCTHHVHSLGGTHRLAAASALERGFMAASSE